MIHTYVYVYIYICLNFSMASPTPLQSNQPSKQMEDSKMEKKKGKWWLVVSMTPLSLSPTPHLCIFLFFSFINYRKYDIIYINIIFEVGLNFN